MKQARNVLCTLLLVLTSWGCPNSHTLENEAQNEDSTIDSDDDAIGIDIQGTSPKENVDTATNFEIDSHAENIGDTNSEPDSRESDGTPTDEDSESTFDAGVETTPDSEENSESLVDMNTDSTTDSMLDTETGTTFEDGPLRIVAIGDIHGTLDSAQALLREVDLVDDTGAWVGENAVLVQIGDQVDRGDFDREVIDLFERLKGEAAIVGGQVISLIGNHEIRSVQWTFSNTTDASLASFYDIEYDTEDEALMALSEKYRGRAAAFRPGGVYARILATRKVVQILDGIVFSHAGVMPEYAQYGIEQMNQETSDWLLGIGQEPQYVIKEKASDSPIWTRDFGESDVDCEKVDEALAQLKADRMVVGHTIQDGINAVCSDRLFRIDVGIYEGHPPAALEIIGDEIRIIDLQNIF